MVLITRKIEFSASHLYHNPQLSAEENRRIFGKCNNPHGHGHNYTLEVTVAGEPDPVTGMVLDLKALKEILEREVMQRMDHRFLNYEVEELKGQIPTCEIIEVLDHRSLTEDVAAFRETVPTTENLCVEIFNRLKMFPKAKLERVRIQETANNSFEYTCNHSEGNRP